MRNPSTPSLMALSRASFCRLPLSSPKFTQCPQCRYASLLRRPKRPYTFTQLITLSDGSTFLHRTTSPQSVYKSNKDARNSLLWNPSSSKLLSMEEDEAGRLKKFREKFGRGWDAEAATAEETSPDGKKQAMTQEPDDHLLNLISGYGKDAEAKEEGSKPNKNLSPAPPKAGKS